MPSFPKATELPTSAESECSTSGRGAWTGSLREWHHRGVGNPHAKSAMKSAPAVFFWRRTDLAGLERLTLSASAGAVLVESTVVCVEDGGFRLDHRWRLSPGWRTLLLEVDKWGPDGHERLVIERSGDGWTVDGAHRPDLVGADEPDLSVTPFCNTLPIRRLMSGSDASLVLDTCYLDAASMTVTRSGQRYDRITSGRVRYVDFGRFAGFEAELLIVGEGLIVSYQNLFERVAAV